MKRIILIPLLSLFILTCFGQEAGKNFIDQNYIEVTGYAEKEITPDKIYIRIYINEKEIKGKNLEEIEKSMIDKLKDIGIDVSKDLVIKDFLSNFRNYWMLKKDIVFTKEYQLLVSDANTAGKVFIELEKIGISNISIERLDNSEIKKFRQEVKIEAIKSAKEEANSLASAIGQERGRALHICEKANNLNMTGALQGRLSGIIAKDWVGIYGVTGPPDPVIEYEKIKLKYGITVRFELK